MKNIYPVLLTAAFGAHAIYAAEVTTALTENTTWANAPWSGSVKPTIADNVTINANDYTITIGSGLNEAINSLVFEKQIQSCL